MINRTTQWLNQSFRYRVFRLFVYRERKFYQLLLVLFIIAGIAYPYPQAAMWLGFLFAGYSAIANDSIQTIGTFLASNAKRPWWLLWLFISSIFVATMTYSWITYTGDVSYERLASKGFAEAPKSFQFLQLAAPLVLLFLTRLKMPVSTTFLCLSVYSANFNGIQSMLTKSVSGYVVSFVTAIIIWFLLAKPIKRFTTGEPSGIWTALQWLISGTLWSVWLMQDGANIAVTLPRSLSMMQFLIFLGYIVIGLGILFYLRGDKIQGIVTEKSQVADVRAASIVDLIYAVILFVFKEISNIPMSTTWVFLGLMAGREMAMTLMKVYETNRAMPATLRIIRKDIFNAAIGLVVSVVIAILVNPSIQQEIAERLSMR
ncbi:MAG TPA: hypothetical protein PKE68_07735 [Saprospiraceae bacterium]|nr:hypothetical protein [Saprospiraceae bacterium]